MAGWRERHTNFYRAGAEDNYDLLMLDNGPAGVQHPGVVCDSCYEDNIRGLRWKCIDCPDYDLCTECYGNDRHELTHKFVRIDTPLSERVYVGSRQKATDKRRSHGGDQDETVAQRYMTIKLLGQGAYGRVFKVFDTKASEENLKFKALKEVNMAAVDMDDATKSRTLKEAMFMRDLSHPNIVKYFDSFYANKHFYICTEFCEGGDLHVLIENYKQRQKQIPENQIWLWVIQIINGVKYIHDRHILHRDIKTSNIFLRNNIVKIGDFGISRILSDMRTDLAHTQIGTPLYKSPQAVRREGYNHKYDIWSIGCVIYELVALKEAFFGRSIEALNERIMKVDLPKWPDGYSMALRDLYWMMMQENPDKRPSARKLQQLPSICEHSKRKNNKHVNQPSVVGRMCHTRNYTLEKKVEADFTGWLAKAEQFKSWNGKPIRGTLTLAGIKQDKAACGPFTKANGEPAEINSGNFVATIDNSTASDITHILQDLKISKGVSPVQTLDYGNEEDPFTRTVARIQLLAYKSDAQTTLGMVTYNQAYTYRREASSRSLRDSDIARSDEDL